MTLQDEEEGLGEAKEHDAVDDGEGEHVAGDHLEDHGYKGPGQLDRSTEEHEVEPVIQVMSGDKDNEKNQTSCQELRRSAWILLCCGNILLLPTAGESCHRILPQCKANKFHLTGMHAKKRMQEITKRIFGGADLRFLKVRMGIS